LIGIRFDALRRGDSELVFRRLISLYGKRFLDHELNSLVVFEVNFAAGLSGVPIPVAVEG
jgi:hypothetical protein